MTLFELREKSLTLPQTPGVYIMKNKHSEIIYIGKAKALKNRVSQYFTNVGAHQIKVIRMIENVDSFDYILTASEFEALVLECSLIKQHKPKYNILLKDDKGYSYIKITKSDYPVISAVHNKKSDNAVYIGPYMSSSVLKDSIDTAQKIFRLPTCNLKFPESYKKHKTCLSYHIGLCSAPCAGKISLEDFKESLQSATEFISGNNRDIVKELKEEMKKCSDSCDYERAALLRDRIRSIEKLSSKQSVVKDPAQKSRDVFAAAFSGDNACINVMRYDQGLLFDNECFFCEIEENEAITESEVIKRFYSSHDNIPLYISTDEKLPDEELISQWLSEQADKKVTVTSPTAGERLKEIRLSKKNADEKLLHKMQKSKGNKALDELKSLLSLSKLPERIESYDISHTHGEDSVAGMIVFKNGKPDKKSYRRFKIKYATGGDDPGALKETLSRRFERYIDNDASFNTLPDLILLDGGVSQVDSVISVLKEYDIDVPVFGMVKDSKHRTRAITTGNREIEITDKRLAFTLISDIQEEVHRYAISYHRNLRDKNLSSSELTEIYGIGEKKKNILLKAMKTIENISKADTNELSSIPGISDRDAAAVYAYYHIDKNTGRVR